jgi:hypothetical protein
MRGVRGWCAALFVLSLLAGACFGAHAWLDENL